MPLTERLQVLLSPAQRRRLERIARHQGRSVGSVIREAVERFTPETDADADDLGIIFDLDLPVGDWAEMKAEIIRAAGR
ncbi:hypothetical protein BH20ACT5_BH20ACT5_00730 [soil metagenome]